LVGAWLVDVAVLSLVLEPALTGIENNGILKVFVSWLTECSWARRLSVSTLDRKIAVIFARSWHLKLQTLPVEDLVRVETRGSSIKTNFLA
jgi:hypothetical protein